MRLLLLLLLLLLRPPSTAVGAKRSKQQQQQRQPQQWMKQSLSPQPKMLPRPMLSMESRRHQCHLLLRLPPSLLLLRRLSPPREEFSAGP